MSQSDLLKKVRKIEIKTRRLSRQIFAGEYHSAFKGRGMAFSEVREYQFGDDVRSMDWNVTARLNSPYVKVFEEERELTVMLLVDVSGSRLFGSSTRTKKELVTEIAAVLAFSASSNNDKVGALFFSSGVEKFIPPKKGRTHMLRIVRELLFFEPENNGTDISAALRYLSNVLKKRCTAFLLSDMIDVDDNLSPRYEHSLRIASARHDIYVVSVYDRRERDLPDVGLIRIADSETGKELWVDTSSSRVRERYKKWGNTVSENTSRLLKRHNIDHVSFSTDQDYVKGLVTLFKK
jgi:uncharacterized protein (DUF58 family)